MLDKYILEKLYVKLGHKLETKADVRNFYLLLKAKDEVARQARKAQLFREGSLDNYHPYAISFGTLERMLGNKKGERDTTPRKENLDRIARFLGYGGYAALRKEMDARNGSVVEYNGRSGINFSHTICCAILSKGTIVRFKYYPDREIELKYCGDNRFYVQKSLNSRMQMGKLYEIRFITPGQMLEAREVESGNPYFCGLEGGLYDVVCGDKVIPSPTSSKKRVVEED